MNKRVGVLGGTFNPIHYGHLRCAEEVRERFGLDRVFFVPAAIPPHKNDPFMPSAAKRLKMVELALEGNPQFRSSRVEIDRAGRSYSVDTLKYFRKRFPEPDSVHFIVGMDAFLDFRSWKSYREIPSLCSLVVATRPGYSSSSSLAKIPVEIRDEFWYDRKNRMCVHASGNTLRFFRITGMEISASAIREKVSRGESIRYLTADAVIDYIEKQSLYRTGEG